MKQAVLLVFVSLFFFCVNLEAQKDNVDCPYIPVRISVDENTPKHFRLGFDLSETVCPGTVVILTADTKYLDSKLKPAFKWTISDGEILSGQGTSSIRVQTHTDSIEATVEISGLPKSISSCPLRISKTINVAACCLMPCTTASITAPDLLSSEDRVFTANARIGDPSMELTYEWVITDGVILEGQGTNTIKAKCLGVENCTVGFDLKGLPPECPSQVRTTIDVWEYYPARIVDSYGNLSLEDEKKRLDSFAAELNRNAKLRGYIIVYNRSETMTEENINHIDRTKRYLFTQYKITPESIKVTYGGYRETLLTELWIGHEGVPRPLPNK